MSRGQRKATQAVLAVPPVVEAAPAPSRPLLQLDFHGAPANLRTAQRPKDASIKESIIRWLEQQL